MKRVSIVGGSGYGGGELIRLLLAHPEVEIAQVTSERNAGSFVHFTHPNLRAQSTLRYVTADEVEPCDLLFLALPHGSSSERIEHFDGLAERIVDLAADFRLDSSEDYERWYGEAHKAPEWLERFVYGLPELRRDDIRGARYVSGVGCNATATQLAIVPAIAADLVDPSHPILCEVKVGSSEAGASPGDGSHHPDRSGAVRSYRPTGHRHTAEVAQTLRRLGSASEVYLSATAIELVRGVLATAQLFVRQGVAERDLFRAYRQHYGEEPFVRLVKERTGVFRYPEPKILSGSNFADVGFELDPENRRLVAICAIDNLMKGAAGTAVQCMNLMYGWEERTGLGFPGLHPI